MELQLIRWRYKGIRGGLSDLEIELGDPPPRWSLIQMPNGTGKTTTMALLRAALSGRPPSADEVRAFRANDDVRSGEFELTLKIDSQLVRVLLKLDFEKGEMTYKTARARRTGGGLEDGLLLPDSLRRLITPEFARLFVFDGELAKQIRDLSKEHAATAICTLYHLDHLDKLKQQISRILEDEQQRVASISRAQSEQGLKQLRTRLANAEATLAGLQQLQRTLKSRIRKGNARLTQLTEKIDEHVARDEGLRQKEADLNERIKTTELEISQTSQRMVERLRNPIVMHPRVFGRLTKLGQKLERLKLPKTMSSEFFQELAEQPDCLCARPIGPKERRAIIDGAENYLAENEIAVINAVKQSLRHQGGAPETTDEAVKGLRGAVKRRKKHYQDLDQLKADIAASADVEVRKYLAERAALESDVNAAELALEQLETTSALRQDELEASIENNIPLCKADLAERAERFATATNTFRLLQQSQRVTELVETIRDSAFAQLRERVRVATNAKLAQLIPSERIEVARIDGALALSSKGLKNKAQVSEGQSLAVAYAFLTSLFQDAPYRLPFVVDSPAVSLDTRVRREVGTLVPNLFQQMVTFIISSERDGFADAFYTRSGVQYVTIWRETEECTRIHRDLETFKSFHSVDDDVAALRARRPASRTREVVR